MGRGKISSTSTATEQNQEATNLGTKSIEGWWRTSKTGKVYAEYEKAGILENPLGSNPGFEKLVPDHIDKNDRSKWVWNSPLGVTYYIFETDETDREGRNTGQKKHLLFRTPTTDYKPGGFKGSFQKKSIPPITDEITVFQNVSMDNNELKTNGVQSFQCDQVSYLMSDTGGKWKAAYNDFKQIHMDFERREIVVVYQLVKTGKDAADKPAAN